jgi:hypothetical protein
MLTNTAKLNLNSNIFFQCSFKILVACVGSRLYHMDVAKIGGV